MSNPSDLPKREPAPGEAQHNTTTEPLHPEVEALFENWRAMAVCKMATHAHRDGGCQVCECGSLCTEAWDAGRILQLLA